MTLNSHDFPAGTPLHHFFVWNESARLWPDRRYKAMRDRDRLPPEIAQALAAAIGNPDITAHAAVFAAFEKAERSARGGGSQRVLVIRLSAFGDFIQALGPIAAIRRHHATARISLLTTRPLAAFAEALGLFDEVLIDERPGPFSVYGWLALRRRLRRGRFDRVYDLQTSGRSTAYSWLLRPGMPEWSGIAWGCSYPHANRGRDAQHTLDKQAEQLLMAGIHPTPLPELPSLDRPLPDALERRDFVLLVPGSSPQHPEKRWPAERFGLLARALDAAGHVPVVIGAAGEAALGAAVRQASPAALDLVGRTDLATLAAIAQKAALTVGNDTGVCHLAAAADCPVIVLFSGGTDPARCAPRGRSVRILQSPRLTDLAAEAVIGEAIEVLKPDDGRCPHPNPPPPAGEGVRRVG